MKKEKKELKEELEVEDNKDVLEEETVQTAETDSDNDEIEALKEENIKLKNEFLRAYADAENTKKRCQQEIEKNYKYAISSFAKELLSVADNLDRAISSAAGDEGTKSIVAGVEMTREQLVKVFEKFGIKKMNIVGTAFDPNYHQVIQEIEDKTKEAGTILQELQTGYMINDRILREAMVIVSKK